jgi:hypothetical protein
MALFKGIHHIHYYCGTILAETFLYGFIVPILSFMVDVRLRLPLSHTQCLTTALLTVHGFISITSALVIAHFTDKSPNCKVPLLISLARCMMGTFMVASATTGEYGSNL